ncbi:MAG: glycoside hydrolase family 95 protein, partial [Polyangiaceae bacterium]
MRHVLELDEPAIGFTDSFLLGNGRFGATVRGGIGVERIDLNLDTFWSGGPHEIERGQPPAHLLPLLRDAIRRGDQRLADHLASQMQGPGWTESYQPLGAVLLSYGPKQDAVLYRRRLDLSKAVASTRYEMASKAVEMVSFVSLADDVFVSTVSGPGLLDWHDLGVAYESPHPGVQMDIESTDDLRWLMIGGRAPVKAMPNY